MSNSADRPFLTVIVATYNAASFLGTTLSSISRQTDFDTRRVSVTLIDGGSSDETVQIAMDSGVVDDLVSEPDGGIYDAMNKGAERSNGTWLHFLNAGDSFENDRALSDVLAALDAADSAHTPWMVAGALNLGGGGAALRRRIANIPHKWWRHALGIQPHCHQATWFRRDVFLGSGGYSLHYGTASDFDLIFRFGLLAPPEELHRITINYLGGGISEKRAAETPRILHRVRVDRMQLSSALRLLDLIIMRCVGSMNAVRKAGGRAKLRMRTK